MKKTLFTALILIICSLSIKSQTTHHLTLEESIEIAKSKSLRMKRLEQDLKIVEYNLNTAKSRLKTHIDLSLTAPRYTETIRQFEDSTGVSFYSVKQLDYSTDLEISQPLPTDGRVFINGRVRGLNDYNTDLRATELNAQIGFSQPLDAFYGYNSVKSSLKTAELNFERTNKVLKREELNLIYQVSSSYYGLLSSQKNVDITKMNLERQTEAYEISKNKYEAGLIREVDALQMEVDLAQAQNNYDIAVHEQTSAVNSFKDLIGLDLADSVLLNTDLKYDIVLVDPEKAVVLAKKNRHEIREQDIQIALQDISIKQQKAEGMVKASIDGYFQKYGVSNLNVSNNLTNSIDKAYTNFKDRPLNYGIGLTIRIPILDWGENKSQVRAAQARQKQYIIQKEEIERDIETEVRNLVSRLNSNLKQLQLLKKSVAVAEKSFDITLKRYSDGDIDSQALALERDRLNNSYSTHLRAYVNYQLSIADLMQKTFYDFKNDKEIE
ncbi:TolC family protein [Dysgonomonas sp. Marseille-P4361]|uniref:TolC family protein n=1 Tax=Dysgonomonas sp. Marseille-P4361 TaxID=2161820 RepID=UPI000D54BC45|nr:TolC family protein [Dysgonomonas sp. Marseille-P4361]